MRMAISEIYSENLTLRDFRGQDPSTAFPNGVVHRIGSQICSIWPLDSAECHVNKGKLARIANRLEYGSVNSRIFEKSCHFHVPLRAVHKSHPQTKAGERLHRQHAPRDRGTNRRHYLSGAIGCGVFIAMHRLQYSNNLT